MASWRDGGVASTNAELARRPKGHIMSDSTQDRIEGTFDKLKGEGKEQLGQATDDERTQGEGVLDQAQGEGKEGMLDQAQGEGKEGMADVKDKAGDLLKKSNGGN